MVKDSRNRLLNSLSPRCRELILSRATEVDLPLRRPFYSPEERPGFACFVTSGLASIVASTLDGETAEVGVIGLDGLVGAVHLMGPAVVSTNAFMQMQGTGIELPLAELQRFYETSDEIRYRIMEFVQEQMLTVSHISACNLVHDVEARLARWLLMAEDRTDSEVLTFTQEFLGMMLGARRTTVTLVAGALQRVGLIEYSRGRVTILDRPRLEEAACDCYQITKRLQKRLYSGAFV